MISPTSEHPVVIVGAGPIGLELAVALRHHGVPVRHFDRGTIGQTITEYPKEVRFFSSPERLSIAGVPFRTAQQEKGTREEYLSYLRGVVTQFDLAIESFTEVVSIEPKSDRIELGIAPSLERAPGQALPTAPSGSSREPAETISASAVVLAIGDMHAPHRLEIPGEDQPHVAHRFDEPHAYVGKRLLVIGGRNSAVEAALRCHRAGAHVSLSYRRGEFRERSVKAWLLPDLKNQIRAGAIEFFPGTEPVSIGAGSVTLRGNDESENPGETREVDTDFVLVLAGFDQDPILFEKAGLSLGGGNDRPQLDVETMESSVPGIYVAGTAVAGSQRDYRLFIENSHPHVGRIVRAITGRDAPFETEDTAVTARDLPES